MLSARFRLRHPQDFSAVMRHGVRAGRPAIVLHLLLADGAAGEAAHPVPEPARSPARVGFVVPKTVGNAVIRNQVVRRLRPILGARLEMVPAGSRLVVRALPPAAGASFALLAEQVDAALASAVRRAGARPGAALSAAGETR